MKNISVIILILANLAPLLGVLFFGWSLFAIMFLYWFENVVIGIFNIPKIIIASKQTIKVNDSSKKTVFSSLYNILTIVGLILFFELHYGMFTAIHGVFVFALFYEKLESYTGIIIAITALFISHGYSFYSNYIGKKEYKKRHIFIQLMFQPYKRVVIMHLTIIFGGILSMTLGEPIFALIVLIALKTFIDIIAHKKEHNFINN